MNPADPYSELMRSVREMDVIFARAQRRKTAKALVRIVFALALLSSIPAALGVYAFNWALGGPAGVALALYSIFGVGLAALLSLAALHILWQWTRI